MAQPVQVEEKTHSSEVEAQNPDGKISKEAFGVKEMSESCTGLESVSVFSIEENEKVVGASETDLGHGNVEVTTQLVQVQEKTDGNEEENLAKFQGEKSCMNRTEVGEVCLVDDCVDIEKGAQTQMNSTSGPPFNEENDVKLDFSKSQSDGSLVDLGADRSEDVEAEKMDRDKGMGEDNLLELNGIPSSYIDSSRKIEVSGDGISLVVDFDGSPNRFIQDNLDVENCSPLTASKENLKEDRDEEQGKNIDNQDNNFSIGDIVWVRTKIQTWWPGKIKNPAEAPEHAVSDRKGASLLVAYYGIGQFVWCNPSQLKPFHENFEQMSRKNKARMFLGAVEKAVGEFGRHVKLEMTCSCALKRKKISAGEASFNRGVLEPESKSSRLGEFSVTTFEPTLFLAHLKDLAKVVSSPSMLDFTVTHNRLSAFHSFIGHIQRPMHLLTERKDIKESAGKSSASKRNSNENKYSGGGKKNLPENERSIAAEIGLIPRKSRKRKMKKDAEVGNGGDEVEDPTNLQNSPATETNTCAGNVVSGIEEMSDKGFDLRERKKSRFLSYPYINLEQKGSPAGTEDPKAQEACIGSGEYNGSASKVKPLGERFWKKWYRRFDVGSCMPISSDLINANPAELLSELCSAAVDCQHPYKKENFGLVGLFLSRFRILVYHDESFKDRDKASNAETGLPGNNEQENKHSVLSDKSKPKITKKKADVKTISFQNAIESAATGNDVQEIKLSDLSDKSKLKRTKKKADVKHLEDEKIISFQNVTASAATGVQDVNENLITFSGKVSTRKKKGGSNSGRLKTKSLSGMTDVDISNATFLPCDITKQEKKKDGEKEASMEHVQDKPTGIPDLNGNSTTSSVLVDDPRVISNVTSEDKPELVNNMVFGVTSENSNATIPATLPNMNQDSAKPDTIAVDLQGPSAASACLNFNFLTDVREFVGINAMPGLEKGVQMISLFSGGKPKSERKKRERKEKAAPENQPAGIPDLNGTTAEPNSLGKEHQETNGLAPPINPEQKKRGRKSRVALEHPGAEANVETMVTALELTFAPGAPLPSKEDFISTFSKFGPLKESETKLLNDTSSSQIVFMKGVDAREAFLSLEKDNPFGETLVKYRLRHLSGVAIVTPPINPEQKKRGRKSRVASEHPGAEANGETMATALELTFAPGAPLPSKEDFLSTFSKFGPLKESETKLLNDSSSSQIVFMKGADAREAFLSLEKGNPFGETLVKYRLRHLSGVAIATLPINPEQKKRGRKSRVASEHPGAEANSETMVTALELTFAPGAPLPSKEDFLSTFSKFGPLKESETKLLNDSSSSQIVFMKGADAREAFLSLEKGNPFGETLVKYRLRHLSGVAIVTLPINPEQKKRGRKSRVASEHPGAEAYGETMVTALELTFAPGAPLPSREDFISTFSKFGPLKESETKLLNDSSSSQVVFMKGADAREAFLSLEKDNPFGETLVKYRLHHLSGVAIVTPPINPEQKKRRRSRVAEANGETMVTALELTFAPGAPLPSKEDFISTFSKFGPLKEAETKLLNDSSSAQIVFMKGSDAREALLSMEKDNPFGETLVKYRLRHLSGVAIVTPPINPEQKKRRKSRIALEHPRAEANGETMVTALELTFAPGAPLPSKEDFISTFSKFGPLKESETKLLNDSSSAQIVFMKGSDAREALLSMEKDNPFGETPVKYRLRHLFAASRVPNPGTPLAPSGSKLQPKEAIPLDLMRHNLQMMTSMLEKSGDNLSPEMRTKLEAEIKRLLAKVSSMTSSSS
ncbi:hypothetical protein UlMin_007980 [Ulmus minor]